ncbi:hypothetical protein MASR2M78_08410 [Treponema sp.]
MSVDRHINFFELQKVCALEGCPLCRLVSDRAERYMDNLLFEHVADRGFRAVHRSAGGFCAYHARNLASFRDGLAVAILGRDILEDRINSFKKGKAWKPKDPCPVCIEKSRIEKEYLGFIAGAEGSGDDERELRFLFEKSSGLCAPHYEKLLRTVKKVPRWLKDFQERRFDDLMARTLHFIELSAYGRQAEFAELSEADQLVWKELTLTLNSPNSDS